MSNLFPHYIKNVEPKIFEYFPLDFNNINYLKQLSFLNRKYWIYIRTYLDKFYLFFNLCKLKKNTKKSKNIFLFYESLKLGDIDIYNYIFDSKYEELKYFIQNDEVGLCKKICKTGSLSILIKFSKIVNYTFEICIHRYLYAGALYNNIDIVKYIINYIKEHNINITNEYLIYIIKNIATDVLLEIFQYILLIKKYEFNTEQLSNIFNLCCMNNDPNIIKYYIEFILINNFNIENNELLFTTICQSILSRKKEHLKYIFDYFNQINLIFSDEQQKKLEELYSLN